MKSLNKYFSYIILFICILQFPFCRKINAQDEKQIPEKAQVQNSDFDDKLKKLLNFSIPVYTVDELKEEFNSVFIIDTREKEEYKVSHIPGARFGGYKDFDVSQYESLPRDTKIVTYCSVGYRSEKIGEKLKEAGFQNVYNLYGSIFEWANVGYELEGADGLPTDSIHTYNRNWSKWMFNPEYKKVH